MSHSVLVASLFVLLLAYCYYGRACWATLCSAATTYDDAELIVASRTTLVGRIGMIALIASWPLWYTLPKIVFALRQAGERSPVVH